MEKRPSLLKHYMPHISRLLLIAYRRKGYMHLLLNGSFLIEGGVKLDVV